MSIVAEDFNVRFRFLLDGKLQFENNSKNEYDIMVHYTNEENVSKTLYLYPNGKKYAREKPKKIAFEGEFIYLNNFTGNVFVAPLTSLTIYPKENRKFVDKTKEEQKTWNETEIRTLNERYKNQIPFDHLDFYREEYYNTNFEDTKNKFVMKEKAENAWENKPVIKTKKSNEEKKYKGLSKLEKTKRIIKEVEELTILRQKLEIADIKFNFTISSDYFDFDSKSDI